MKKLMCAVSGLALLLAAGCQSMSDRQEMNEPAGAEWRTNSAPENQARDINQKPYPGADSTFDATRGVDTRSGIHPEP